MATGKVNFEPSTNIYKDGNIVVIISAFVFSGIYQLSAIHHLSMVTGVQFPYNK
jgi:hypothetical protein